MTTERTGKKIYVVTLSEDGVWEDSNGKEVETFDKYELRFDIEDYPEMFKEFKGSETDFVIHLGEMFYHEGQLNPDSDCPWLVSKEGCEWWDKSEANLDFIEKISRLDHLKFQYSKIDWEVRKAKSLSKQVTVYPLDMMEW